MMHKIGNPNINKKKKEIADEIAEKLGFLTSKLESKGIPSKLKTTKEKRKNELKN